MVHEGVREALPCIVLCEDWVNAVIGRASRLHLWKWVGGGKSSIGAPATSSFLRLQACHTLGNKEPQAALHAIVILVEVCQMDVWVCVI